MRILRARPVRACPLHADGLQGAGCGRRIQDAGHEAVPQPECRPESSPALIHSFMTSCPEFHRHRCRTHSPAEPAAQGRGVMPGQLRKARGGKHGIGRSFCLLRPLLRGNGLNAHVRIDQFDGFRGQLAPACLPGVDGMEYAGCRLVASSRLMSARSTV